MCLLKTLKAHNKKLLLDESFIDFCDVEEGTLLQQEIIDEFPNLIIIKSLSKSYGIPGLRLGMLACKDTMLIRDIRRQIPIWNINSFAEYFLQIIGKYTKDYRLACRRIAQERKAFYTAFEETGLFNKIYPSQANYFLCKLSDGFNATNLSCYLLEKCDILIKYLDNKKGFPDGSWVRIAIRNQPENDLLIEKLKAYRNSF
jgi:histidinol-phosphate/aromatic aminotransferase/cobyric acid decarboxylase-like protein